MKESERLVRCIRALQIALGGTAVIAGFDKFTNLLVRWDKYLNPEIRRQIPVSSQFIMRTVGALEVGVGVSILQGHTKVGGYVAGGWLFAIAANLVSSRNYLDIAARDFNMAVAAIVMAGLTEVSEANAKRRSQSEGSPFRAW